MTSRFFVMLFLCMLVHQCIPAHAERRIAQDTTIVDTASVDVDSLYRAIKYPRSRFRIYLDNAGPTLGLFGGSLEYALFQVGVDSYHEVALQASIGIPFPLNGYVATLAQWSYGQDIRLLLGAGADWLYHQLPRQGPGATFQPLSDSPVNPVILGGVRVDASDRILFKFILVLTYDMGDSGRPWPFYGISAGYGF